MTQYASEPSGGSARIQQGSTTTEPSDDRSLGQLVASATADVSTLMRKELELAKVEIKQEAKNAGKGAAGFAAAAALGAVGGLFLLIALAYGVSKIIGDHVGWGFFIVAVLLLVVAGIAALIGKKSMSKVGPPEKTLGTIKDDVAFAKRPTDPSAARGTTH